MKLTNGAITILVGSEGTKIELHDNDASIQFATIKLTNDQLASALSRLAYTPCDIELRGLNRISKKMEHKTIEFEVPPEAGHHNVAIAERLAEQNCPKGWKSDNYFNSQDSFFNKDGKQYARCTIRRWI